MAGEPGADTTTFLQSICQEALQLGFAVVDWALPDDLTPAALARALSSTDDDPSVDCPLSGALDRCLNHGPVLICLDNLHWTESVASTLATVFSRLSADPLVVCLAQRPGVDDDRFDSLFQFAERRDAMRHERVPSITDEMIAQALKLRLGVEADPAITEILACADGNAHALSMLLDCIQANGDLRTDRGVASASPPLGPSDEDGPWLPGCLLAQAKARLMDLSPQTRRLVVVGATLGREFSPKDVAQVLQEPLAGLLGAFEEAAEHRLLRSSADALCFRHELIRQAIEVQMLPAVRAALHYEIAELYYRRHQKVDSYVGHLLLSSVGPADEHRIHILDKAAQHALPTEPGSAARLALRGLELADGRQQRSVSLTVTAVQALTRAGPVSKAITLARDALALDVAADVVDDLRTWSTAAVTLSCSPRIAAERTIRSPDTASSEQASLRAWSDAAVAAFLWDQAPPQPPAQVPSAACDALLAWNAGSAAAALAVARAAVEAAPTRSWATALGDPRIVLAVMLSALQLGAETLGVATEVLSDVDPVLDIVLQLISAEVDLAEGRIEPAVSAVWQMLTRARETDVTVCVPAGLSLLNLARAHRPGPPIESAQREVLAWAERQIGEETPVRLAWSRLLSSADHESGVARSQFLKHLASREDECRLLFLREPTAAAWTIRHALALRQRDSVEALLGVVAELARVNSTIGSFVAAADHAAGLSTDDAELLDSAARSSNLWVSLSAIEDWCVHMVTKDVGPAVSRSTELMQSYKKLEAEIDEARLRRTLRSVGVTLPRRRSSDAKRSVSAALSSTEVIVADLVATGGTNRQIASQLFISPHTVASHLRSIYRKMDVKSRVELAQKLGVDRR